MPPATSLPAETLHLPFEAGAFRMAMGLVACPPDEIVELDDRYEAELADRRHLLETRHREVFAACLGPDAATIAARKAVLDRLAALLPARYPGAFRRDGDRLFNLLTSECWDLAEPLPHDPLEIAGRLVQEDLCIIRLDPQGPILDAAILCAPSRWRLLEKIGRPLGAIHTPVPFYAERLGKPVDRLMRQLKPGRAAMRLNWSVVDDPALFQPTGKFRAVVDTSITAETAATRLHLRVERQTLSRLNAETHVLFTIRVHSYPLHRVATVPGAPAGLAQAVRASRPKWPPTKACPSSAMPCSPILSLKRLQASRDRALA